MSEPCVLIVELDILVRHPLAEYLRECGYKVLEAADADEARELFAAPPFPIDIVLADVNAQAGSSFALAGWIRANHPEARIVLAGTIAKAAEKAGELCDEGPQLTKPYDHRLVLDHIRRVLAARDRGKPDDPRSAAAAAQATPTDRLQAK